MGNGLEKEGNVSGQIRNESVDWQAVDQELVAMAAQTPLEPEIAMQQEPDVEELDTLGEEERVTNNREKIIGVSSYDPSVQQYLESIGDRPLLQLQEEVAYGEARIAGDIAEERLRQHEYLPDEKQALEQQVALGQEARHALVQSNLKLVVSVARRFYGAPLPFLDMIQEGNIGLMRAANKYDPHKNVTLPSGEERSVTYRFSTYATWWIRQGIQRAIHEQSRVVRLPIHIQEAFLAIKRATVRLQQTLDHQPSPRDIGEALGISEEKVRRVMDVTRGTLSLEAPKHDEREGEGTLGDAIEDRTLAPASQIAEARNLARDLESGLDQLPPTERKVLLWRYGFMDGQLHTLDEVGKMLNGMTRERIRQIEADALRRLRNGDMGERLVGYFDNASDIRIETRHHISDLQFEILDMLSEGMSIAAIAGKFKGSVKRPDIEDLLENEEYGLRAKLGAETYAGLVAKAALGNVIPVPRATPETLQRFSLLTRQEVMLLQKQLELSRPSDPKVIFSGNQKERKQAQDEALGTILEKLSVATFEQAAMVYASVIGAYRT